MTKQFVSIDFCHVSDVQSPEDYSLFIAEYEELVTEIFSELYPGFKFTHNTYDKCRYLVTNQTHNAFIGGLAAWLESFKIMSSSPDGNKRTATQVMTVTSSLLVGYRHLLVTKGVSKAFLDHRKRVADKLAETEEKIRYLHNRM